MTDNRRLEDLKRRVQQDPASIAFAALADEYRRMRLFHDAIETCREGLLRHPAYLSARVTLGRALLEIGEYDEAEAQLEQVIRVAPDNLAAIRALADIHHKRGDSPDSYAAHTEPAPSPAPATSAQIAEPRITGAAADGAPARERRGAQGPPQAPAFALRAPATSRRSLGGGGTEPGCGAEPHDQKPRVAVAAAPALQVESHMASREPDAAPPVPPAPEVVAVSMEPAASPTYVPPVDPVCERLEEFLAAIERAREATEPAGASSR